jgi:hypothetical protein
MLKSNSRFAAAGTAIAVATSATAVLLLGGGSATAAGSTSALQTAAALPANSVTGPVQVKDGTLYQADLAPAFVKALYGVYNNTVTTPSIVNGAVTEGKLSADVQAKLNKVATGEQGPKGDTGLTGPQGPVGADGAKGDTGAPGEQGPKGDTGLTGPQGPAGAAGAKGDKGDKGDTGLQGPAGDPATDAFGKQGGSMVIDPTAIATIGGSWVTGKTDLKSFNLPAGTWLINSAVTFDRKDANAPDYLAPATDTMPQFALRFNITDTNKFGDDAGTIMGNPISRAGYTELTGSSTKTIILDKTTTITAYGFGYNEDRSGFGGGQITAGGQVTAVKIG